VGLSAATPWVTLDMTRGLTGPQVVRGPVTEDTDLAVESPEELAAMNAGTVLSGHGGRGRIE
jgi:hypothetical protein